MLNCFVKNHKVKIATCHYLVFFSSGVVYISPFLDVYTYMDCAHMHSMLWLIHCGPYENLDQIRCLNAWQLESCLRATCIFCYGYFPAETHVSFKEINTLKLSSSHPFIHFLSKLLLHSGLEGWCSISQLSEGDGGVSPWKSDQFFAEPHRRKPSTLTVHSCQCIYCAVEGNRSICGEAMQTQEHASSTQNDVGLRNRTNNLLYWQTTYLRFGRWHVSVPHWPW